MSMLVTEFAPSMVATLGQQHMDEKLLRKATTVLAQIPPKIIFSFLSKHGPNDFDEICVGNWDRMPFQFAK